MAIQWRCRTFDSDAIEALSRSADISPLLAHLLLNRNVSTADEARRFLDPKLSALHDPETLPGVVEGAALIHAAILEHKKIVIYGDYDVDGVCGTSLLWACLKLAGAKHVEYYIPHRVDEGYGVNADALRHLANERGAQVVITVDCGISAVREARLAKELGLTLIITDHHHIGDHLPEADVLIHPGLPGSKYPFRDLCGCGVALKLAWQVAKGFGDGKKASPHMRDFLLQSLHLVALATVADVMPLVGENRSLVTFGLKGLSSAPTIGLKALLEVSGLIGPKSLNSGNVGFKLAPRINAAGRLARAMLAVEMLTSENPEHARSLALQLDGCNNERRLVELAILGEARGLVEIGGSTTDRGGLVVAKEGWHSGVIGIVASRLVDSYHRPTVVVGLRDGHGQGSARSVSGFNLYDAIKACSSGLTAFGGHAAAAGLKIPESNLADFAKRFNDHCMTNLTHEQKERVLRVDAEILLSQLDLKTVASIERLEPHGIGNPKPLVQINRVSVVGEPKGIGENGVHLKLRVAMQGSMPVGVIGWNLAERFKSLKAGSLVDLVASPGINSYQNRREVQLDLKDMRLSVTTDGTSTSA